MAARQFKAALGVASSDRRGLGPSRIAEFAAGRAPSTLPSERIPYSAKLFVLDLLPHERMIYFDADLLAANRWYPATFNPEYLHVVRDRIWRRPNP